MATITVPGMLLTGDHASRPAASAVGKGTLYSCSTHSLVYQSDGSSWSTWATLGETGNAAHLADTTDAHDASAISFSPTGTIASTDVQAAIAEVASEAGALVPGWVSNQVGTTDSTHFYWDGNDIASFTEVDVTGTTTWAEGKNMASVLVASTSADDVNCLLIAQTISTGDAWKVCVKGIMGHTDTGNATFAGIIMTDGTTSGSNGIMGHIQTNEAANVYSQLLVGRSGTLTSMTTAPWVLDDDQPMPPGEIWIKLTYVSANTFRVAFSPDDVTYHSFGEADISKTMTPTHVGLVVSCFEADGAIITFGPLLKV